MRVLLKCYTMWMRFINIANVYRMRPMLEWPKFVAYQVLVTFQVLPYTDPQVPTTHAPLKTL